MRHASRMLLTAAVVVLVASALPAQPLPRQPGQRPPRRPRPGMPPPVRDSRPPGTPYGSGTKTLEVDCGKTVGTIRSLLGVNRGPLSWARGASNVAADHTESLRSIGVDFIRTHDFYGPTDWHVIFPDFKADPADPASYDFGSSDVRIKAICERGFRCLFRLGTSWKGPPERRPMINDPPGTIREPDDRILHRADRDDFRKWARISVGTVRHYTDGWADGFRFPITYWEIWNEPDLREQFWTGTPEQYYAMYEEAAKAIKAHNPKLKVGGPACTGALREPWVEGFIRYCRQHKAPLDFFSWHSYGGRGEFNPHTYYDAAARVRKALDRNGFTKAENICDEWNAGIKHRLFNHTPAGAAFYASALAAMLDGGVDHAFQYCADAHPGLGLHERGTGRLKICADAFAAWKRLLETPVRVAATGGDARGYAVVAGKDPVGHRVRILISDFQSGHDAFALRVGNLPWDEDTPFTVKRSLINARHRLETVEETTARGRSLTIDKPFSSASVCLIEIDRHM